MGSIILELQPDRLLLDSNFDGYKLSLQNIPSLKKRLDIKVDRVLLDSSQYSLLHTKLFGLHNHLVPDIFDENDSVYYVDAEWNVCKVYIDPFSNDLVDPVQVWQIPQRRERQTGDYNVSMKFLSNDLVVLSDGMGMFYILHTGAKNDDTTFTILYSDEVISNHCQGFIIADSVYKSSSQHDDELHVLLLNVQQDTPSEGFLSVIHWVTFTKNNNGSWGQVSLRQVKTKGSVQYLYLEKSCEAFYVVSDNICTFTLNSEHPIVQDSKQLTEVIRKTYTWTQTLEDISIKFSLKDKPDKNLIKVKTESSKIEVNYGEAVLLFGNLYQRIDADLTTWNIENSELEVVLCKGESGLMWPELVPGDQNGEYVLNTCIIEEVHEKLQDLCSDALESPQGGTTFNSQQVEECDFENDKATHFERLCGTSNSATHKINLGAHQILLTTNLSRDLPPAMGIRHDVDVCLWQPHGSKDDFHVKHEGTLLAFGYVQASKQNRKFCVSPQDLNYSAICESSRHLFIYRQNTPVSSGELKNRSTGRRVRTTAQQQVVNIPDEEVVGIYASNHSLILLGEEFIMALKI